MRFFYPSRGLLVLAVLLLGFFQEVYAQPSTFWWRGHNSAEWEDPTNWDVQWQNTGPIVQGLSTDPIPGVIDDVIFDDVNAGGSVSPFATTVSLLNVNCRDLTYQNLINTHNLSGNKVIKAYRNVTLAPPARLVWNYTGVFIMKNTLPVSLTTNGIVFNNHVIFDGPTTGASVTLTTGLETVENVRHYHGELILPTFQTIDANGYHSIPGGINRVLTLQPGAQMILQGSFQPGDPDSYPWYSRSPTTYNVAGAAYEFRGQNAYVYAENTTFWHVWFTHANNGGQGVTTIQGQPGVFNKFEDCTLLSHGTFIGSNEFNSWLELVPGHLFRWGAGETQRFLTNGGPSSGLTFNPFGQTCPWTTFESTVKGQLAYMESTQPQQVTSVIMKDIAGIGTGTFDAFHSYGGPVANPGWDFVTSPPAPQTYIWRGVQAPGNTWPGNGQTWSDPNNWSVSGMAFPYTPPTCAPGPMDDVIFPAIAFAPGFMDVTIDVNYAYCHRMWWDPAVPAGVNMPSAFGSTNRILGIRGNLRFSPNMALSYRGLVHFLDEPDQFGLHSGTIRMEGQVFENDVYFNGCNARWRTLQPFATVGLNTNTLISSVNGGIIYHQYGELDLAGNDLSCRSFNSYQDNNRELNIASSHITLTGQDNLNSQLFAWHFRHSDGTGGLTMPYATHTSGSLIEFQEKGSLNIPLGAGLELEEVLFNKHGSIHGSNTFYGDVEFLADGVVGYPPDYTTSTANNEFINSLILAPGKAYTFERDEIQLFTAPSGDLNAVGDCQDMILIKSSHSGAYAKFNNQSGSTITVDFCILQYLDEGLGGSSPNFIANNSFLFNCISNWQGGPNPNQLVPLYWVGGKQGSDSWKDGNNWSITSGGTGLGCVPSPGNDAIFDTPGFTPLLNSNVTVDPCNAYCHTFAWKTLPGPTYTWRDNNTNSNTPLNLSIYGSFDACHSAGCGPNLNIQYDEYLTFETDTDPLDYLSVGAPNTLLSRMFFRGSGKTWTQLSDITTSKEEYIYEGTHALGSHGFTAERLWGYSGGKLDMSDASPPTYTLTGTYQASPLERTWNTFGSFDLIEGTGLVEFNSPSEARLYAENNLEFWDVTFGDPLGDPVLETENIYSHLYFIGNGNILEDNTIKRELLFSPGKTYTLEDGKTQSLITSAILNATGAPFLPIQIQSSVAGVASNFYKTEPQVCTDWLILSDIHNISPPIVHFWAGSNSQNAGNNVGWIWEDCGEAETITICDGMVFQFVQPPTGTTFSWNFDDGGATSTLPNPTHTFSGPGAYYVYVDAFTSPNIYERYVVNVIVDSCCTQPGSNWPVQGGLSTNYETGNDVEVDYHGDVYATGNCGPGSLFGASGISAGAGYVVKYNDCGDVQWLQALPNNHWGVRLKLDYTQQTVYVIAQGSASGTIMVLGYAASTGALTYSSTISVTGFIAAGGIDVDQSAVYICGSFSGNFIGANIPNIAAQGNIDGFVARRPLGQNNWTAINSMYDTSPGNVQAHAVRLDDDGNVYVVGDFVNQVNFAPGTGFPNQILLPGANGYIAKYNSSLNILDNNALFGRVSYYSLAVDNVSEQVFALNNVFPGTAYIDAFDRNNLASVSWTDSYFSGSLPEYYRDATVTNAPGHQGLIVAGGQQETSGSFNGDAIYKKYDLLTGAPLWPTQSSSGTGFGLKTWAQGVAVTSGGHLIFGSGVFRDNVTFGSFAPLNTVAPGDDDMFISRMHDNVIGQLPQFYKYGTGDTEWTQGDAEVNIFPNPTDGAVTIEIAVPAEQKVRLRITDFYGRTIRDEDFQVADERRILMDLSGEASGFYFVTAFTATGFTTQKVVLTD